MIEGNTSAGHVEHGIFLSNTVSNYISGNWLGQSAYGVWFANGGYGVALTAGASYNFLYSTAYGNNRLGPRYVDPGAVGNDIRNSWRAGRPGSFVIPDSFSPHPVGDQGG